MAIYKWSVRVPKKWLGIKVAKPARDSRIHAKLELWKFLDEVKDDILNWEESEEELARQIVPYMIYILHPHFTALEVENEIRNVYRTFNRKVPDNYITIFTGCFERYILAKIKVVVKQESL